MHTTKRPLEGVRVLDIATFLAAPFAGTIMADFGADVIKIEQPREGDPLRKFGTPTECGDTLIWLSEARNKRFMTLDLRTPAGKVLFLDLVAASNVVLENFRPGTLERWGLGYEQLRAANPRIVLLRVSAYGQTGPYKEKPGFARVAHGFSGLTHLSGMPDGPPVVPGSTSLADYISGLWGAVGVLLALRDAERTGEGQVIDVPLYASVFRLLDELVPAYAKFGEVRGRLGTEVPHVVPHGHWKTADDRWIALACSSDKIFARLAKEMGRLDLAEADRFATNPQRIVGRDIVNREIANWVASLSLAEVVARCDRAGVPCGPVMTIADIFDDPHYAAREDYRCVEDDRAGEVVVPSALPRLSRGAAELRHLGGALGAHTAEILRSLLSLSDDEIDTLKAEGAV
ncbi:CaiB/BaiF CoA transferase family protein [Trinickia acidisoli]|uniref:CaiB/BaiF CoA transferase family protein n=1 Tax=Trinickia acidisoli TaxID=2767482 RepID=UPI001A8D85D7|nr:CaiB/BaiF CoA-transferase family protein [Trinickia acidisoli]